ncbi:MAG: hypothetical protein R8G33_03375 [Gammaproteobacteria bacterium]|nr:hypothetical protein [Gammaproteobacteria bacterium]
MNINTKNVAAVSALTITLGSLVTLHAEQNPFAMESFTKPQDSTSVIASGSCGQGMCGGNSSGMGSGNMPQGILPTLLPDNPSEGAQTLIKNCAQCHGLPAPGLHTAQEWPSVVQRMKMHISWSKKWMQINVPDEQELNLITNYLQEHAQTQIDATVHTDLDSETGKVFSEVCVQCHVLPDPGQHTAAEWPSVVERMLGYMNVQNKQAPNEEQTQMIVEYLQNSTDKS